MKHVKLFESFLNENEVFTSTLYRVPTEQELMRFDEHKDMSAKDIFNEICYTLVGRGILDEKVLSEIKETTNKLSSLFPDDKKYQDVVKLSNELKPRF